MKVQKGIRIVIGILILFLSGYVIFNNLFQMIELSEKTKVILDRSVKIEALKDTHQHLKENLVRLKTIKQTKHLKPVEYQQIIKELERVSKSLEMAKLDQLTEVMELSDTELYQLMEKINGIKIIPLLSMNRTLRKIDSDYNIQEDLIEEQTFDLIILRNTLSMPLMKNYKSTQHYDILSGRQLGLLINQTSVVVDFVDPVLDYLLQDGGLIHE